MTVKAKAPKGSVTPAGSVPPPTVPGSTALTAVRVVPTGEVMVVEPPPDTGGRVAVLPPPGGVPVAPLQELVPPAPPLMSTTKAQVMVSPGAMSSTTAGDERNPKVEKFTTLAPTIS